MKKFNLITETKGYNKNRNYLLKTKKNFIIGNTNYKLGICINNKYMSNKYLKLNIKASDNILNNLLYNIKNIND